jgi:predicted alpha/beta-hydrolase family hydrolase
VTFASANTADRIAIPLDDGGAVLGLLERPARAEACYVLAHGAGAGMTHPFLNACAEAFARHNLATLRFQFPFLERGSRRPDSPAVAQSTVRAAVKAAAGLVPDLPLIAGGRSFGGRMSSQAQASLALPGVVGLAFLGFPLHPAKRPSRCSSCRERVTSWPISRTCGPCAAALVKEPHCI